MKKIVGECTDCKAKFEDITPDEAVEITCPSCGGKNVAILETVSIEFDNNHCQGCSGCSF